MMLGDWDEAERELTEMLDTDRWSMMTTSSASRDGWPRCGRRRDRRDHTGRIA